jgi:hypothetical protein
MQGEMQEGSAKKERKGMNWPNVAEDEWLGGNRVYIKRSG